MQNPHCLLGLVGLLSLERRNGIVENTDYCPHISYFSLGVFLHFGCLAVVNVWAAAE